jgi:RelA/SpoT family (p)ppGpp synthetase
MNPGLSADEKPTTASEIRQRLDASSLPSGHTGQDASQHAMPSPILATKPLEETLFEALYQELRVQGRPQAECDIVQAAYEYAREKHEGQFRKNQEKYIVHPIEVARILTGIPLDIATIVAALLHDVLEDTTATETEIKQRFGDDVLKLVTGVTKLGKLEFSSFEDRQAENFRRMFLAMAEDTRVILLKLADRLHNMRTLCHLRPDKQQRIATETLEVFAPLANRMGMGKLRAELEDLSLRYVHPEQFEAITTELAETQTSRQDMIDQVISRVQQQLDAMDLQAKIYGRVKNYYSIYKKMTRQHKGLHDIYDISAVRILVHTEPECYEVLGVIHNAFKPIPGRFKDYVAMPKSNLYQSLHTAVIGPMGRPIEVQIRTHDMHRVAEYGIAAHWKYKEAGGAATANSADEQKLSWLRQMLEMKNDLDDARDYVDSVKLDLFRDEVFVFSPKGQVVDLPKGSTPVDFAYRIHTEVGHKCVGALVNGRIVTLDAPLRNGDIVEIITGKKGAPRLDWIKFVQTHQARTRIRQWYKRNFRQDHEAQGRQLLEAELTKAGLEEAIRSGRLLEAAKDLNFTNIEDLFLAVGYGEINPPRVLNRLQRPEDLPAVAKRALRPSSKSHAEAGIALSGSGKHAKGSREIQGLKGMLHHLAKCCTPVPGDAIAGVVTRSRGVMVHREDCCNLEHVNPERVMWVDWEGSPSAPQQTHAVRLEILVIDRMGVFKDILGQIADTHTNLSQARVKTLPDHTALIEVTIDTRNTEHLETVRKAILSVPEVVSVIRQVYRPTQQQNKAG